jgi:hypothetical protein
MLFLAYLQPPDAAAPTGEDDGGRRVGRRWLRPIQRGEKLTIAATAAVQVKRHRLCGEDRSDISV